ncbi:hypothetical protein [Deinococcus hopiensis]|uniref:hypothetical protein n=1 Tax=Deinococcus hopiensis TaxID=309885 RepID=UPI00111C929C|nr:hypothetical protein [Deinococcus hopiensis]
MEMGPDGESLLNEIVELAIYIDFLVVKIEEYSSYPADTINSTVKNIASKLEKLYFCALHRGIPLNTAFKVSDKRGKLYEMHLTGEGIQYRVL